MYPRNPITRIVLYSILIFWLAVFMVPVVWMVLSSLKPEDQVIAPSIQFLPREVRWQNYADVWIGVPFNRYIFNSTVVAGTTTVINVLVSSLAGYGLSKFSFFGRKLIFLFILSSIMVPFQVMMIPLFILAKTLKLLNSLHGLIIPTSVTAFGVFLMRQTILPIPNDFTDSARIDGCNEVQIYWRVILPLARVAIVTLVVLHFLGSWNDLIWPLLIVFRDEFTTLPLALTRLQGDWQFGYRYERLMSIAVIMSVPVILLYIVFNRFLTRGIAMGGLKG
jgi:ABC-type glycerol-3-phosphate transport system permease component